MWKLNANDLRQLKGSGGERFAHFVDRLIRGQAARGGLAQSEIRTQLRVNIPDGGVDTEVKLAVPRDPMGWFGEPTCWQYKAEDASSLDATKLEKEIHKPYVKELISKGYAYRLCLLGDLPPSKNREWESLLKKLLQKLNPSAPDPKIVHGGDLLPWAEEFPAVITWLRDVKLGTLHWEAWRDNCRAVTPHYVPNPNWDLVRDQIRQHADFNAPPVGSEPCLTVGGAAGVGKTRLVFETLHDLAVSPSLVVYAADEQEAKSVATSIASTPGQTAILVADECTPITRHFLNENLRGHMARLRVISLDNTGERLGVPDSQIWLSPEALKNTDAILEANFPHVPPDRRQQYSRLSGGFVRLAADMCHHDAELARGDMAGLLVSVERYVRHRLKQHLPLISLLALFHKVGFREDVYAELEPLCQIANCTAQQFRDAVREVRESPGFVVQSGRYWYVTPEIVAHVLFAEGWTRWAADDLAGFLSYLPDTFHQQLIDRAGKLGDMEVREQLASFFRRWFGELTADNLRDPGTASLASALVETNPEQFVPLLRSVIEGASGDALLEIRGHAYGAKWGPRRTLVWLLENLVSFSEFFSDCEACLFRLALFETEPQIGNNATRIWEQLFSVYLSGTEIPFEKRIAVLRTRTASNDLDEAKLAFKGLARALDRASPKLVGRSVVAGRLRPADWQPSSPQEELACYWAAISICEERLIQDDQERRQLAFDVLADSIFFLLQRGLLGDLSRVITPTRLTDMQARKLLNVVDEYLEVHEEKTPVPAGENNGSYAEAIREWIAPFLPSDFDGLLRTVCAREPWDRRFSKDVNADRDETDELAQQIIAKPSKLYTHLDWLATPEAQAAERLGFALGRADEQLRCGKMIFDHTIVHGAASLLRGYIRGLVFAQRSPTEELLERMTQLECKHPKIAVDILSYAGDSFDGLNRVIRLVESGTVPSRYLVPFAMGIGRRELRVDEVGRLLPYFVDPARAGDAEPAQAGIRFISMRLHFESQEEMPSCLQSKAAQGHVWELVEAALPAMVARISHEWIEIVKQLTSYDPFRAIDLLGRALMSIDIGVASQVKELLTELASAHPDAVMNGFGKALLDEENGWRLQVSVFRDLVAQLPVSCALSWVRQHGIHAARAIARHLPRPYLDDTGRPVVPELLDTILREYNEDDELFENFLAGAHSGEVWWGDASEHFRRAADHARKYLTHENPRIRQWANCEIANCERIAKWEEQVHAERFLPS